MRHTPKILAVASGGGHWVQLLRLRPAFEGCEVVYVTVDAGYAPQVAPARVRLINDGNRASKAALLMMAARMLLIVLRERPDVVISTGAAPGYFALRFGRLLGARTLWLDSIANVERLSMSGELARKCSDLWLTQWAHLAGEGGPRFEGSVL